MSPEEKKQLVVGKIARFTVKAPDGSLVAAKGLHVNPVEADIAEVKGVLDDLLKATVDSGSPPYSSSGAAP